MTPRQNEIWNTCNEYWYIVIRYNSWANAQYVFVKCRKIDKQNPNLFQTWCQEHGDNMYSSKSDAENRVLNLLNVFK